ncbi:MAG TPA: hypoxanthine/guanine phosphoribosyltransferase [Candidatus Thermoplasmatota archaeon]|nr:hypoxanthine/guanine phosphoribosyltransferase [Candidatus Thermoplasmatota archaeon]
MTGEKLRASLAEAPVVRFGDYPYFIHPLTDGIPALDPAVLAEVVAEIVAIADLDVDKIVTVEAMGIPLGTALSLATGIPMTVIRKRRYGLPGEMTLDQTTGYGKGALHINGLARGDRVLFVDDVISTGGTLAPVLAALSAHGVMVKDVVIVFEKGEGRALVEKATGRPIKSLQRIAVAGDRVVPL